MLDCLSQLTELVDKHRQDLQRWSWFNYLLPALPFLNEARLLRNEDRHSLRPATSKLTWPKVKPSLQAAMDLSAYWAMHPIWTDLRYDKDGWIGTRIAGNSWPRPRRRLDSEIDFPGQASRGAWQTAVKIDSSQAIFEYLNWDTLLEAGDDGRSWWLNINTEVRGSRLSVQQLDLDSGALRSRFGKT
jgi:hypothetical protein